MNREQDIKFCWKHGKGQGEEVTERGELSERRWCSCVCECGWSNRKAEAKRKKLDDNRIQCFPAMNFGTNETLSHAVFFVIFIFSPSAIYHAHIVFLPANKCDVNVPMCAYLGRVTRYPSLSRGAHEAKSFDIEQNQIGYAVHAYHATPSNSDQPGQSILINCVQFLVVVFARPNHSVKKTISCRRPNLFTEHRSEMACMQPSSILLLAKSN